MALTAPGGVSNSSARRFSNVFGRIANDNYNRVIGSESTYEFYLKKKTELKKHNYHRHKILDKYEIIKEMRI